MVRPLAFAVVLVALAATGAAQEGAFRGTVDVHVVNVPVVVVGADGYPVRGLTVDDFRVVEDGGLREVTNFWEVAPELADPAGAPSGAEARELTRMVLAFDNRSLDRRSRRTAVEALQGLVSSAAGPATRFMVLEQDDNLSVRLPFTSDPETVSRALEAVLETPCEGSLIEARRRALHQEIYRSEVMRVKPNGEIDWEYGIVRAQTLKQQIYMLRDQEVARVRHALAVLEHLLRPLGGFSGRTILVWVGSDLTPRPALALYDAYQRKFSLFADRLNLEPPPVWAFHSELVRHLEEVTARAQSVGVTIHAIDPRDHDAGAATADFAPPSAATWDAVLAEPGQWTPGTDLSELRSLWEGAHQLAAASGGSFVANTRILEPFLDRLRAQTQSYYWIGYVRPAEADGEMHSLDIEVACDGCRVRHAERVLDRTPAQRLADLARAELLIGDTLNPLGLRVTLEPRATGEPQRLLLAVPSDRLLQIPDGDDGVARILVVVMAVDGEGGLSQPHVVPMSVRLPEGVSDPSWLAVAQLDLLLEDDTRAVAVAIRDQMAGIESAAVTAAPAAPRGNGAS